MSGAALGYPIRGIIPPLVTPLCDQQQLDVEGLERLVDRLLVGGVHGLFVLGTTGEGPSLRHDLRHQVVEHVCDQVAGRLPVFVGITDTSMDEAIELAERAYSAGASAVVAAPPYYLPLGQSELAGHFRRLADRCPLPLVLYNMPSCTKVAFAPETVVELCEHVNVIGLKDSSGDLDYLADVVQRVRHRSDFSVLVGPEELLVEAMRRGAHGGVHGGANLFPRLYVALYEALVQDNRARIEQGQRLVMSISRTIYGVGQEASRVIKGIKCALGALDVCEEYVAEPFESFQGSARDTILRHVQELLPQLAEYIELELPSTG